MMTIRLFGSRSPRTRYQRKSRSNSGCTTNQQTAAYTTSSPSWRATAAGENCAAAIAVITASSTQPITSLIAADVIATAPRRVFVSPNSIMIRPRIGIAVIENAVAMNSSYPMTSMPGARCGAEKRPMRKPTANGSPMLAADTARTARRFWLSRRCEKSKSSPI